MLRNHRRNQTRNVQVWRQNSYRRNSIRICTFGHRTAFHEQGEAFGGIWTVQMSSRWLGLPAVLPGHWCRRQCEHLKRRRTLGKLVYSLVCNSGHLSTILFQDKSWRSPVWSPSTAQKNLGPPTQFWGVNVIQKSLVLRHRQWHQKLSSIRLTLLTCFHTTLLKCH